MSTQSRWSVPLVCVALFVTAVSLPAQTNPNPAKPKIGIMKFEVTGGLNPGLGDFVYSSLLDAMVKSGQFTVVDWEQIDRVLQYVAKSQPTVSPEEARKQAIHQLGLEKMYVGSVNKIGSKYYVAVKILNLDLSVERSERVSVANEDELERAVGDLADTLLGRQRTVAVPAAAVPRHDSSVSSVSRPMTYVTKTPTWTNSLGMKFVPVPGTKVLFCIWETRVRDYEAFVNDTRREMGNSMMVFGTDGWRERSGYNWQKPGFQQTPDDPVVGVNWNDAVAFCEWLTKRERKENNIQPNQTYRLPTDEEWSYAVGLSETTVGLPKDKHVKIKGQYPWGRQWPPPRGVGNYAGSESRTGGVPSGWKTIEGHSDDYTRTAPVGSFAANDFGLYDLGGNVNEWCEDRYDNEHDWRAVRGGAWNDSDPDSVLSSRSGHAAPNIRGGNCGFRVILAGSSR